MTAVFIGICEFLRPFLFLALLLYLPVKFGISLDFAAKAPSSDGIRDSRDTQLTQMARVGVIDVLLLPLRLLVVSYFPIWLFIDRRPGLIFALFFLTLLPLYMGKNLLNDRPHAAHATPVSGNSDPVIGDLGGIKVRIAPRCASYVEYDKDPNFGESREAIAPTRTYDSRLRSFGIDALLPTMTCLENARLQEHRRENFLNPDNPWISIGINAGEIYPKAGPMATDRISKSVTNTLDQPTEFWFANYERLPDLFYGLDAYVVTGINPKTGQSAKQDDQTDDIFIEHINPGEAKPGVAKTYIACGKTNVPGGVPSCRMAFGLEPQAEVYVSVRFTRSRLAQWQEIREAASDFLLSFEVSKKSHAP